MSDLRALIHTQVSMLTVPGLKTALKDLGLGTSGRKAQLQERLLTFAELQIHNGELQQLEDLKSILSQATQERSRTRRKPRSLTYSEQVNSLMTLPESGIGQQNAFTDQFNQMYDRIAGPLPTIKKRTATAPLNQQPRPTSGLPTLKFLPSPFYTLEAQVGKRLSFVPPYVKDRMSQSCLFLVDGGQWQAINEGKFRVYFMSQQFVPGGEARPLYYPFNNTIVMDGQPLAINTRGVRGKPGTARPVDITEKVLQHPPRSLHRISITIYVNNDPRKDEDTQSKTFFMAVFVVQTRSVETLIKNVENREHITEEEVRKYLAEEAAADDLESTETIHSLNDPVMFTRIKLPIRSTKCKHIDCMDAESFLMLQLQASSWTCPHCNSAIDFETLRVDDYFAAILKAAADKEDQVAIQPDGSWQFRSTDSGSGEESEPESTPQSRKRKHAEIIELTDEDEFRQHRRRPEHVPVPINSGGEERNALSVAPTVSAARLELGPYNSNDGGGAQGSTYAGLSQLVLPPFGPHADSQQRQPPPAQRNMPLPSLRLQVERMLGDAPPEYRSMLTKYMMQRPPTQASGGLSEVIDLTEDD